jgi:toxin ParE1/3/4
MTPLLWTRRAREDLIDIWSFIAVDNTAAADRLLDSLVERAEILRLHPDAGPLREDIAPQLRVLSFPPYVLLYRSVDEMIEIVRVVHGARDQAALI